MRLPRFLVALCLGLAGCVAEPAPTRASGALGLHRGAVLTAAPDVVWAASKQVLAELGRVSVEEANRTATVVWQDGSVTVRVEPLDGAGRKSILRLSAREQGRDALDLADRIQLAIQEAVRDSP